MVQGKGPREELEEGLGSQKPMDGSRDKKARWETARCMGIAKGVAAELAHSIAITGARAAAGNRRAWAGAEAVAVWAPWLVSCKPKAQKG